jgi:hypothetical protein
MMLQWMLGGGLEMWETPENRVQRRALVMEVSESRGLRATMIF